MKKIAHVIILRVPQISGRTSVLVLFAAKRCCPGLILQDDMGNIINQGNSSETRCSVFGPGINITGSLTLTGTYQNFRLPEGKQMVNIKTHILFIEASIMCHSI